MEESRFAFIIHPENQRHRLRLLQQCNGKEKLKPRSTNSNQYRLNSEPFHLVTLKFHSGSKRAVCDVILCPLLPEEMVADEGLAVSRILESVEIAKSRGASIVGLGGFTSIVGRGGLKVARESTLPLTSGNTYTASSVVKAIILASKTRDMNLGRSSVAIIGATGDIGSACAKALAESFGEMILVARNDQRLEGLAQLLMHRCNRVSVEKRAARAAGIADVVITVTSSLTTLIEANDLKKNSVVCDVSYPANIARELQGLRPDVLVFEGGIVTSEQFVPQLGRASLFWEFNPRGGMHACFVEVLLLSLESKFTTYSIGRGYISLDKMYEMDVLANKYSFHPIFEWNGVECDERIRDLIQAVPAK